MPVVPVANPSNVTTNVSARATESSLGGLADGLDRASDAISPVVLDLQMRENADLVLQAENSVRDAERERRVEIESRKGTDAFGVTKESEQWWSDTIAQHSSGLQNDQQRQMFDELMQQRRQVSLDTVSGYEAAERRNSFNQTSAAVIEGAIDNAAESALNPVAVDLEKQRILETVGDLADSNGWTPEMRELEMEKHTTAMHAAVINSMMADSPLAAQEYFKTHRKEISGPVRSKIDSVVKARVIDHNAQELAERHYTGVDSFSDATKKVRAIKNPDLQKATREAVRALYADDIAAQRENEAGATDEAWKQLGAGVSVKELQRSPELWENIPGTTRIQMQAYENQKVAATIKPVTVDDFAKLTEAERAIEANLIRSPEDLEPYLPFLQESTRERLRKAAIENTTVPLDDLRKLYEARIGRKRDNTSSGTKWRDKDWDNWKIVQDYVSQRVKSGAQATDVAALVDEFFLDGYGAGDRFLINDPDVLIASLQAGRDDFVFNAPEQFEPMLQELATELGTSADELYTKGGRDAILMLNKLDQPVTTANIKYILGQLNAN